MKGIWKKRKRNRGGFTLAETLITILILLMVAGIVGAAIPTATNVYVSTVDTANAQVLLSTAMNMLRSELGTAQEIDKADASAEIVYKYIVKYPKAGGTDLYEENYQWSKIKFDSLVPPGTVVEEGVTPETVTGIWVYDGTWNAETAKPAFSAESYRMLVSKEAITKNLQLTCDGISFDSSSGVITFSNLRVVKDGVVLASRTTFEVKTLQKDRS